MTEYYNLKNQIQKNESNSNQTIRDKYSKMGCH